TRGEWLALAMGGSGCLAFLLVLMSRRDELATLRRDLKARFTRKRQERKATKLTWDAIQKIELAESAEGVWAVLDDTARDAGCDFWQLPCLRNGKAVLSRPQGAPDSVIDEHLSGPMATFRINSGELRLVVTLHLSDAAPLAADIAFRALQRLTLAVSTRL